MESGTENAHAGPGRSRARSRCVCEAVGLPTAGCNEVDPSGLLLGVQYGVQYLRGTVIFRVSLPKKHPGAREVAWSNITAKRCNVCKEVHTSLQTLERSESWPGSS